LTAEGTIWRTTRDSGIWLPSPEASLERVEASSGGLSGMVSIIGPDVSGGLAITKSARAVAAAMVAARTSRIWLPRNG